MPNDLATLNSKLDTQLDDAADDVWGSSEKDDLITWAVAGLYPRLSRELDPEAAACTVTLVADDYFYALDSSIMAVSRVDWISSDSVEMGALPNGTWEVVGDPILGTAKLHVAPAVVDAGGTLRLKAYGRFDVSSNPIPDDFVSLVLAMARAEAYRRLIGERSRFKQWLSRQQVQNTTVNELILLVNEADAEAERLRQRYRTPQKPVPGRI